MPDRKGRRPGEHYAQQLSKRLMEMGFIVEIRPTEIEGTDWADVWMDTVNRLGNIRDSLLTNVIQQQMDDPYSLIKNMLHHSM